MEKRALAVGMNDYPGTSNDLSGCLNDVKTWKARFEKNGIEVQTLADSQVTVDNLINNFEKLFLGAGAYDLMVFQYSGHGTQIIDSGLIDESDGFDEAIWVYDSDRNGPVTDDKFREILDSYLQPTQTFIAIFDSCFGGGMARTPLFKSYDPKSPYKIKFIPSPDNRITSLTKRRKGFLTDIEYPGIIWMGCKEGEYSNDAWINGAWHGAFTYYADKSLESNQNGTWNWHQSNIGVYLPDNQYDQTPTMMGSEGYRTKVAFEPFYREEPQPEPIPPTPDPEPETWCNCFRALKKRRLQRKRRNMKNRKNRL